MIYQWDIVHQLESACTYIGLALKVKTQFYEFLVVECCISLNMHLPKSL